MVGDYSDPFCNEETFGKVFNCMDYWDKNCIGTCDFYKRMAEQRKEKEVSNGRE